jgi:PAS domain S-box-containing protein
LSAFEAEAAAAREAADAARPVDDDADEIVSSILMVDDHPANLVALEAILRPLGQRLVRAHSGEEALRALLKEQFAVILMDVQMPGIDGLKTAQLIKERERTRHIPIIFLTAISKDPSFVFQGYERGAVDYILKPFDPEILRSKVSVFVQLHAQKERIRRQAMLLRQREREEYERRTEHRFRALVDAMPQCLLAARLDGSFYRANAEWVRYTGLGVSALGGDGWLEVVHPDDRALARMSWAEAVASGEPVELELRIRRRDDGQWRWHLARAVPNREPDGLIVGFIATLTDIHDLKTAQVEAREARLAAERASRIKDEFLATISHELRTPLNAILGWARLLSSGQLDEAKQQRALKTIERNAKVQTDLIEDLLDVSRIITGKLRIEMAEVDLAAIIHAAVEAVRPAAAARRVRLVAEIRHGSETVWGDAARLQQVLWNLLSNAIKFTPDGGLVRLRSRRIGPPVGGHIEVSVSDTGIGIEPSFLPFVFDRFRQADSSTTRNHGGLGLGLAIVRHLVEQHGGSVAVESDGAGRGATFTVLLPVRPNVQPVAESERAADSGAAQATEARPAVASGVRLDGVRVLIVDDEVDARDLLGTVLGHYGATVEAAASAGEAIVKLTAAPPDVIVSDIGMPGEDGYALIQRVRALDPAAGGAVPAIALTGFAAVEDARRAVAAGFQHHLSKPVEPTALVELVARVAARGPRLA